MKKQFFILVLVTLSVTSYGQDYDAQIKQKQNELNSIDEQISQKQNQFILANSADESESAKYKLAESKMKKANDLYNKGAQNTDIVSPEQLSKLLSDLQQSKKELSEVELTFKQSEVAKVSLNNEINSLKKQRAQKEIEVYEVQARQFDEGIKQTVWVEGFGESIMDENKTLKQAQDLALEYAKIDAIKKGGKALTDYIQKSNPSGNPSNPISTQSVTSDKVQIVEQDQSGDYGKIQRIMQGDIIKFTAKVRMKVQSVATYNPYREKIRQLKGLASTESSQQIENTISSNGNLILSDGLIAYYPFNGNANDESGNNNHATVYGATLTTDRNGNANNAYLFDGSNNKIAINNINIPASNFTVNFLCYFNGFKNGGMRLIDKAQAGTDNGFSIDTHPNSTIRFCGGGDCYNSNINLSVQKWYNICVIFDNGNLSFYLDGKFVNSVRTQNNKVRTNSLPLLFGSPQGSLSQNQFLNGKIDEVRIYNRALNLDEIRTLYGE